MSFTYQNTPDKNYFDITISNLNTIDVKPPILYFNETRNSPFVLDPESYYLSIVRFSLDTNTLPIIIPTIQPNQNDVNLTIYSITLNWTDPVSLTTFTYQSFLEYSPQDLGAIVPSAPSSSSNGLQNNTTDYYNIYNFQYWILLVNQCFSNAYFGLNLQVVSYNLTHNPPIALPSIYSPVMTWDTQTSCAILSCDNAGYNDTSSNYIGIYFNPAMYNLFSSFPTYIYGLNVIDNGANVRISTTSFGGSNLIPYPPSAPLYTALQIIQEYSTISSWTPITSIVFTSNTLPVVPNNVSAPLLFYNGNIITNGNNCNIAQVITDFIADSYKPQIIYAPTAQYRLVNMTGNTPLYNLDVGVFWKSRTGELIPFRLPSGGTCTIKILFTRKNTEDGSK